MTQAKDRSIADWKLDRLRLGEVEPAEAERIRSTLEQDPSLRARLKELAQSDREILERYPAAWMSDRICERARVDSTGARQAWRWPAVRQEGRTPRLRLWPIPVLSLAAAVFVILVVFPRHIPPRGDGVVPAVPGIDTRIKGPGPRILLYRKTTTGSEQLADGSTARVRDLVLVRYEAAGRAYGVIVSIDGSGNITRHLPVEGERSVRLRADGAVSLDSAYELDDAPRWEKFYLVTSDDPFDVNVVMEAAFRAVAGKLGAAGDSLGLAPPFRQSIFTLRKEARRER